MDVVRVKLKVESCFKNDKPSQDQGLTWNLEVCRKKRADEEQIEVCLTEMTQTRQN